VIIDSIASKKVNSKNGDLEFIEKKIFDSYSPVNNPAPFNKVDILKNILVFSQLQSINNVLELAELNLIFSCKKYLKSFCEKHYPNKKDDTSLQEKISGDFLLNSIIYYNASFDYIRVLLRFIYSSYDNLKEDYTLEKIKKEIKSQELEHGDWSLALGSLITRQQVKDFCNWLKNKKEISRKFKGVFKNLEVQNNKLRKNYQANQLKHGALPCFKKTDESNTLGFRYLVGLEEFYNCKNNIKIAMGSCKRLEINKTQKFLIKYHNGTINLINFLPKIKLIENN
jgi:hypothetical protein